ncbi:MAG: hypothetical protein J6J42_01315 [Lachnospiraceae bacterium]|nr:hypothetical protein [Lachnospiraceae bacterium]
MLNISFTLSFDSISCSTFFVYTYILTPDVPVAGEPENGNDGKVYDLVFGWITTGEAVSDSIDNDGSLDKQVGTMGK